MRLSLACLTAAFAVAATTAALGQAPAPQAQCRPTQITASDGPVLGFNGEGSFQVQACAPGDVLVGQGNIPAIRRSPDFDPGSEYYGIFNVKPCELPGGSDLPGAPLAISFVSANPAARATKTLTLKPDTEKPTLKTTSTPRKGARVKPGDTIKVRMEASEEYADRRMNWQTGVKKIQLIDESPNPVVTPHWEATGGPRPCKEKQWKQFLEVTYTVPPNPPPVIRLRAIAEDFAGNKDDDLGEFPTGDWSGTIKKTLKGGGHNHTIDVDFAFETETGGTIKGRARARIRTEAGEVPGCTLLWTYSPGEFDIPLSGRRDGENFEIALEPGTTTATLTLAGACAGGQTSNTFPSHLNPAVYAQTKYRIIARDGATDTIERTAGALPWGNVQRDTITIHQARQ